MSGKIRWIVILGAVLFVAVLIYSSIQQNRVRREVCVSFNGATHCATAAGRTADEAIHSAKTAGCALLTNGRDENIQCLDREPLSVKEVRQ